MELWAAIDLLGGSVVTLRQGRESQKTSWKQGAKEVAKRWEGEGADGLHIIDLDAAFGKGSNRQLVSSIAEEAGIPVQVGGGVRSGEAARELLDSGVSRVIIGTIAYTHPKTLLALLGSWGAERLVVAADYGSDGRVMAKGWTSSLDTTVFQAARKFRLAGVENLLVTAVEQDGTGRGPDVPSMERLCSPGDIRVMASGGIRDAADLVALARAGASGAVIGRALYEGGVRLRDAKEALGRARVA